MTLTEIKNLTYQELKDRREELVKLAGGNDLAAAFVQALTDAKLRDEKLGEQGKTLAALEENNGLMKSRIADLEATCKAKCAECDKIAAAAAQAKADAIKGIEAIGNRLNDATAKLAAETARANRLAVLCARSEKFINAVVAGGNELQAARMVETTNEG